jgi:hypothetical protein
VVKALVLLPICHSSLVDTGDPPPYWFVPTARSMPGARPGKVMRSETAEMCSAVPRVARYWLMSSRSEVRRAAPWPGCGILAALAALDAVSGRAEQGAGNRGGGQYVPGPSSCLTRVRGCHVSSLERSGQREVGAFGHCFEAP